MRTPHGIGFELMPIYSDLSEDPDRALETVDLSDANETDVIQGECGIADDS